MELECEELKLRIAELEEDILAAADQQVAGGEGGGEDGNILKVQNEKLRDALQAPSRRIPLHPSNHCHHRRSGSKRRQW